MKKSMLKLSKFSLTLNNEALFTDVDFSVSRGEVCCIATGVLDGGTSLLKCCAGIMQPNKGLVFIDGCEISTLSDSNTFKSVRYCYELLGLIRIFTVYDNLFMPMMYHNIASTKVIRKRIYEVAEKLEISDILLNEPMELNDVQMRLVNLARGIIVEPKILLVDEIQAGMSDEMRDEILDVLVSQSKTLNQTLVITTTAGDRDEFADSLYSINNDKLERVSL